MHLHQLLHLVCPDPIGDPATESKAERDRGKHRVKEEMKEIVEPDDHKKRDGDDFAIWPAEMTLVLEEKLLS